MGLYCALVARKRGVVALNFNKHESLCPSDLREYVSAEGEGVICWVRGGGLCLKVHLFLKLVHLEMEKLFAYIIAFTTAVNCLQGFMFHLPDTKIAY